MRFLFLLCVLPYVVALAPSLWGWDHHENNYSISAPFIISSSYPQSRHEHNDNVPSACSSAAMNNNQVAFSCPHLLMFSTDMFLASMYDGLFSDFYYAVAGSNTDTDCGKCFQIRLPGLDDNKQLVVQIFNFGYDVVVPGQFDLLVGGGGFGYYTACNSDCHIHHCQGGPCGSSFYGGTFKDWTFPTHDCYGGGVRIGLDNDYGSQLWEKCQLLSGERQDNIYGYKDETLWQSCFYSHILGLHKNFDAALSSRVKCPNGLTLLTGMRRDDDIGLPNPHPLQPHTISCHHPNCITTTQDCCKPACSYNGKGGSPPWNKIDSCDIHGFPFGS